AIRLKKDYVEAHNNLGNALHDKGQLDEAISEFREALRLKKDDPHARYNLGNALWHKGQLDQAISEFREALRLRNDFAEAHCNLGGVFLQRGRFANGLAALRGGHDRGPRLPRWPYPSAQGVRRAEQLIELDAKLPKVLKGSLQPADTGERV